MPDGHAVSPNFGRPNRGPALSPESRVNVYDDRVRGWQLDIAEAVINGDPKRNLNAIPHSGYAVLHILLSYIEMVGQYLNGQSSDDFGSKKTFIIGFKDVFGPLGWTDDQIGFLYKRGRCGIYHSATAKRGIVLSGKFPAAINYHKNHEKEGIEVNPHLLPKVLTAHHSAYVARLRAKEQPLLDRFLVVDRELIED